MKTILLTGATGFLGSHLLQALIQGGYSVVILKRSFSDTWRIEEWLSQVKSYNIDGQPLNYIFEQNNIDCIIHLATCYKKTSVKKDDIALYSANVTFPIDLLNIGIRHNLKAFINTGTFFEYDWKILPIKENSLKLPFNFYAETKLIFNKFLTEQKNKIKIVTLRLFSPYGPKDNDKIIPYIIKGALSNTELLLFEDVKKLDFIYVDDVINAYMASLDYLKKQSVGYSEFNIGSGQALSAREIISILEQQIGKTIKKKWSHTGEYGTSFVISDISMAKEYLNWSPHYSIYEGLDKTISYYARERNYVNK